MENMSSKLEIQYETRATVITLKDEKILEDRDIRDLEEALRSAIEAGSSKSVVLDFSSVQFMSSAVLGLLIKLSRRIYEKNGKLALCGINPKIYEIFKITRLTKIFDIYKDVDKAIDALVEN